LKNLVKSDKFEYFSVSALDLLINKHAPYVYSTTRPNSEQPERRNPGIPLGLPGCRTNRYEGPGVKMTPRLSYIHEKEGLSLREQA